MDLRNLDWDRLRVFQVVAETGSINAAAARLAVSPAKIGRDIDELEVTLGNKLFERSRRGMKLSSIGSIVLKSVTTMADSAKAIAARVTEVASNDVCRVTIAAGDAIATYWLSRRLADFHAVHPNFEIMLKVVSDTPSVADGDADISIQYEAPTTPNVISVQLGWLHYILYATPAYLGVHGVPETMFDLGRHRFLLHAGYNKQVDLWDKKTPSWLDVLGRAVQSNSSTVILESCACDAGVALMPSYVSEFEPRVRPITNILPLASIRFWLVYTEHLRNAPRYQPVLAWLRDCFDPEKHPCFRETYRPPALPILKASA